MHQLAKAKVLISGMRGLGVEIAKNLVLAGVKSVIVQDSNTVEYADLSSQVLSHVQYRLAGRTSVLYCSTI